jgi:hypothetical protein
VVLVLAVIEAVTEPDAPDDIEVCAKSSHDVPAWKLLARWPMPTS